MKALFCYDGPLSVDEQGNYYGLTLNNSMFSRYYEFADALTVAINTVELKEATFNDNYSKINLENFRIRNLPRLNTTYGILFNRLEVKKRIIEELSIADFLIVRLPSIIGNVSIEVARSLNKPYLIEVVGCPRGAFWHHSLKGKMVAIPSYFAMKKVVKEAASVIYVTNEFLQKRYPSKGYVLGCSDVVLPKMEEMILERRKLRINNKKLGDPIILGTVAAVNVRYKAQRDVIKSISKLNKDGYNFNYHLVGDGDTSYLRTVAEKYGVADKIKFLGALSHDKVFNYLDNIDLYIQPSKTEGLPRALLEAMSRACPAIGSNVGGIPELLSSDYIFQNGKVDEIYRLIKRISTKNLMIKEAEINFSKAKEYDKGLLDHMRSTFYKKFAEGVHND